MVPLFQLGWNKFLIISYEFFLLRSYSRRFNTNSINGSKRRKNVLTFEQNNIIWKSKVTKSISYSGCPHKALWRWSSSAFVRTGFMNGECCSLKGVRLKHESHVWCRGEDSLIFLKCLFLKTDFNHVSVFSPEIQLSGRSPDLWGESRPLSCLSFRYLTETFPSQARLFFYHKRIDLEVAQKSQMSRILVHIQSKRLLSVCKCMDWTLSVSVSATSRLLWLDRCAWSQARPKTRKCPSQKFYLLYLFELFPLFISVNNCFAMVFGSSVFCSWDDVSRGANINN